MQTVKCLLTLLVTAVLSVAPAHAQQSADLVVVKHNTIYLVELETQGLTRLADGSSPAWSPDGTQIAWFADNALRLMNADGSDQRVLLPDLPYGASITWSPDGQYIAATAFDPATQAKSSVIIVTVASGETVRIPDGTAVEWSPDGAQMAWLEGFFDAAQLWVMDAAGSNPRRLTRAPYGHIAWSPDGAYIATPTLNLAYHSESIKVIRVTDAVVTPISGGHPAWLPDGRLVYDRNAGGISDLFLVDFPFDDISSAVNLTGAAIHGCCPLVSPDGLKLAYLPYPLPDSTAGISVYDLRQNTGQLFSLPNDEPISVVLRAWAPDSRRILYSTETGQEASGIVEFGILNASNGETTILLADDGSVDYAAWRPVANE